MADLAEWLGEALTEREHQADDVHRAGCASLPSIWSWDDTAHGMGDGDGVCDCGEPASVLRTIAAHRAIVARHSPRNVMNNDGVRVIARECEYCIEGEDAWTSPIHADWPCPDVLSLLSIYQDRPGFDPSWRAD